MQVSNAPIEKNERLANEPVILISGLKKAFGSNQVLDGFNLQVEKGENVAILGKSGSGKSVLIKCVIGLLVPDGGRVDVFGQNVAELSASALDRLRAKIGFLFQSNALYDSMTVRENLEFSLRRHWLNVRENKVDRMVVDALEDVGLVHTIDQMPEELSGGMRKRVAFARALILRPELILYDEPTAGLDPITGKEISELMVEMAAKYNTSSLIISHDLSCIRRAASRVAILIDGKVYAAGSYEELQRSGDPQVKQFFE